MNQKLLLSSALLVGMAGTQQAFAQKKKVQDPKKPNVVFILADDLGFGDLSCYGQEKFETPNIDKLAQEGMRFTQCYSGTTVSAPSRSCLLTGTHSGHTAIRGNVELDPEGQFPLPADAQTIFHDFQNAGYKTGAFGKWGLGFIGSTGDPKKQGIDEFYGYNCQLLAHSYYPDHLWDNDKRVELKDNTLDVQYGKGTYSQDLIHSKALDFLDRMGKSGESFCMWYPTIIPHAELIVPEDSIIKKFRGKYPEKPFHGTEPGNPAFRKGGYCSQFYPHATFAAMVYRLDVYVGQIVQKLKEMGVYDNTIIIFASDNGPHMEGGADPDFFNSNGIWRGYKRDLYEGGIRVPLIVAWKGHIRAGAHTTLPCTSYDFYSTICELAGVNPATETDGISFYPTLMESGDQMKHSYLYWEFMDIEGQQAVRMGKWKGLRNGLKRGNMKIELYDLETDSCEQRDVALKHPEIVKKIGEIMKKEHTVPVYPAFRVKVLDELY